MRFLDWQTIPDAEARSFLNDLNPYVKPKPLDFEGNQFRWAKLSFLPDRYCCAVTLAEAEFPESTLFSLYKPGDVMIMNWTNEPVYRVAEMDSIVLDRKTTLDYSKFFFDFVRGQQGRFIIVEQPHHVIWNDGATPFEKAKVDELLMPVAYKGIGRDNRFILQATVLFKNALFRTNIRIAPDGLMELTDEELLLENLSIPIDPPTKIVKPVLN